MFWPRFIDLQNFILLVRTVPFFRKIIFISSYTEKYNYFLLYELIQDLPYSTSKDVVLNLTAFTSQGNWSIIYYYLVGTFLLA